MALNASGQAPSLEQALDDSTLSWTNTGTIRFFGAPDPTAIGGSRALATLPPYQSAELSTTIPGSGIIDFSIAGGLLSRWTAKIDDTPLNLSVRTWPYGFRVKGEGPHTLTITYNGRSGEESVSVDNVIFRPDRSVSLTEALDRDRQSWLSPDNTKWVGSPYFSLDGNDAAWCGGLADGETSTLKTFVQGPAEFSFWWQITTGSYTLGDLLIDGRVIEEIASPRQGSWEKITATVGPGRHQIEIRATGRDPWRESPARGLWVDQFSVAPLFGGTLSSLASPPVGTLASGHFFPPPPGSENSTSLGVSSPNHREARLYWPLEESPKLRLITFSHRNTAPSNVYALGSSATFTSGEEWTQTALRIPPGQGKLRFHVYTSEEPWIAELDNLVIREITPLPLSDALGPIAEQLTVDGWHAWPTDTPDDPVAGSSIWNSTIQGTMNGPSLLKFDLAGSAPVLVSLNGNTIRFISQTGESSVYIPPGEHSVQLQKRSDEWTTIRNLRLEPLPEIPLGEASGSPELIFTATGTRYNSAKKETISIPGNPFWGTPDDGIYVSAGQAEKLELTTQITGPCLFSFERQSTLSSDAPLLPRATRGTLDLSSGSTFTSTGVIIVTPIIPAFDPGTSLLVNGRETYITGRNDGWIISIGPLPTRPVEPMSSSNPEIVLNKNISSSQNGTIRLGWDYTARLGRTLETPREGWEKHELYLGPGEHTLTWKVGAPNEYLLSRTLRLANLNISPVLPSYAEWAGQHWFADPEVENAIAKLSPWQDPIADPDEDGYPNSLEYAYGTNPRLKEDCPPAPIFETSGQPCVIWPSPPTTTSNLRVYHSTDLTTWTTEGINNSLVPQGLRSQTATPSTKAFFRLEADVTVPSE
ncbi:MAG: hypothetical protein ACSHYF_02240 [Verrucomicrobiaceae bacterium]